MCVPKSLVPNLNGPMILSKLESTQDIHQVFIGVLKLYLNRLGTLATQLSGTWLLIGILFLCRLICFFTSVVFEFLALFFFCVYFFDWDAISLYSNMFQFICSGWLLISFITTYSLRLEELGQVLIWLFREWNLYLIQTKEATWWIFFMPKERVAPMGK